MPELPTQGFRFRVGERAEIDTGTFGAPGRLGYRVRGDELYITDEPYHYCSVPLRNVGAGVAVITRARTEPDFGAAEIDVTARLVRPGERFRVDVSVHVLDTNADVLAKHWRGSFVVVVDYHDARGGQPLITRALIGTYATLHGGPAPTHRHL